MKWVRKDCANWRIKWELEKDGHLLLVVRDKERYGPVYWWRVRKDGKNLAKGNAASFKNGARQAHRAFVELEK